MIKVQVTPGSFDSLAAKLKEQSGIALTGYRGTINHSGVTAEYTYDGMGELQIAVTKKPLLVSKSFCETRIKEALEEHGVACTLA